MVDSPATARPGTAAVLGRPSLARFRTRLPPPRDFTVTRPRLLARLDAGLQHPLTLITGPAGTGKTFLAETWVSARHDGVHVAWLTLDHEHDQAGVFWRYVLEALRGHGVDLAALGYPLLPHAVERSFLEDLAALLGDAPEPVVLVLDQLDRITDERVLRQLDFVLDAAQPAITVVATSRREPGALTHRRRLRGEMTTIQAADLAFTLEETAQLLRRHGLDLPQDAVVALHESTEGWAAGLRLSALAMGEHGERAGVNGRPWAERRLALYLVDEVLDALPDGTRELLLSMCVVDRVEVGLARSLAGRADADHVLHRLAGDDLFVTTGTAPERWYRIHHLLLEALRDQLRGRGEAAVSAQHDRAARWYDARGDCTRAAVHHVAAGSWVEACASVVRNLRVVELLEHRAPGDLTELIARVPDDLDLPVVQVVRAAADLGDHRIVRAAEGLARWESAGLGDGDDDALRASVSLTRLVLASVRSDTVAAADAWRRLEPALTRAAATPRASARARALALSRLSGAFLWGGDLGAFEETVGAAAEAAEADGCAYERICVLGQQALAAYHGGSLRDAARLGEEAERLSREHGLPAQDGTGAGHLAMSLVALEWNDRPGSLRHLEHAERTTQAQDEPALGAAVALLRAHHHALDGRRAPALEVLADLRSQDSDVLPAWLARRVVLTEAWVRLRCGDAGGAVAVLEAAVDPGADWRIARAAAAQAVGDGARALALVAPVLTGELRASEGGEVTALLLSARIRSDAGDVAAARRALLDALRLGRAEGRRRPFVEAPGLQELVGRDRELTRASSWVGAGLVPRPRVGDDTVPLLVEPLTRRETGVLALMAQVMSVADIAADLYISVNTVKTHQKSIYRKLSVARAHDAVRRGRDLDLI